MPTLNAFLAFLTTLAAVYGIWLTSQQLDVARDSPREQALMSQRVEGCGEIVRSAAAAELEHHMFLIRHLDGPRRPLLPPELDALARTRLAVINAIEANELFFERGERRRLPR